MRPSVLLTGATGAVGSELLRRLAARKETTVNALVRRGSTRQPDVAGILHDMEAAARVVVFEGELRDGPTLGLAEVDLDALMRETTHIVHCGGSTSFTLPLGEARALNVGGTQAVLDFARRCDNLSSVAIFSTLYVSGKRSGVFSEDDFGDAGTGFVNSYEQSKAEVEKLVRNAMHELPVLLLRLGTVAGDSHTGAVRGFNAIHHAVRLVYNGLAPMIPGDPDECVDIVSSDFVADAALHLIDNGDTGVFHLASGAESSSSLADLIGATVESLVRFRPAWRKRAIEKPLIVDLDTYELFVRSVEEAGNEVMRDAMRSISTFAYQLAYPKLFDTARTRAALKGSGIAPARALDFYPRVVKYCLDSNWGTQPC
ncbi:MAG TPA: SDR family oxidoreductase [Gemmatimonadaceae bacterium]|nr:SDR family oxidoreductase [Gemmatimonadaceae bacterium]